MYGMLRYVESWLVYFIIMEETMTNNIKSLTLIGLLALIITPVAFASGAGGGQDLKGRAECQGQKVRAEGMGGQSARPASYVEAVAAWLRRQNPSQTVIVSQYLAESPNPRAEPIEVDIVLASGAELRALIECKQFIPVGNLLENLKEQLLLRKRIADRLRSDMILVTQSLPQQEFMNWLAEHDILLEVRLYE